MYSARHAKYLAQLALDLRKDADDVANDSRFAKSYQPEIAEAYELSDRLELEVRSFLLYKSIVRASE